MENNIKVSVLTPIYNHKAEYLQTCLESLHSQTLREMEFILIDNGATQESKDLIAEFEKLDSRFKVIHLKENIGYGGAMNRGLAVARGEYIGVVESDDWIEPDMYEQLYGRVKYSYADIIKGAYFEFNSEKENYINKFPVSKLDRKLINLLEVPQYINGHTCFWSAIYRKEMLSEANIRFEERIGSVPDISFIYYTFINAKSIYLSPAAFYHYRLDNPNSTINAGDQMAWRISEEQEYITKYMLDRNLNQQMWNLKISQEFDTRFYNYFNRCKKTKLKYIIEFSKVFREYQKSGHLTYYMFNKVKKANCKFIMKHPVLFYVKSLFINQKHTSEYSEKSYFGILKKKYIRSKNLRKYYLLGIQIYHTSSNYDDNILEKILSVKNDSADKHKIVTLLGIKFKFKKHPNKYKVLSKQIEKIQDFQNKLYAELAVQNTQRIASIIHRDTFGAYKNAFKDKNIVIVACGPSVNMYKNSVKNAIHIGINRAFMYDKVDLDFLFVQDYLHDEEQMNAADNYRPGQCKKFYGIIPDSRLKQVYPEIKRIPFSHVMNAGASQYILEDKLCNRFAHDISYNAIADYGGCVFSALQFALYTNPKRIYLVGCDCSEFHFHKEYHGERGISLKCQYPAWEYFKKYVDESYSQTEIISINPVNLKHLFKNAYTDENGELTYE